MRLFSQTIAAVARMAIVVAVSIAVASSIASAQAADLTQYFPAAPEGEPAPAKRSGWRIEWRVLEPNTHGYGGSSVWEFRSIEFMKGIKPDGTEDWIKVLNNLAMAEMYVPYHNGVNEYYDITQFSFSMIPAEQRHLPKFGAVKSNIEDRYIISEVVNDGIRWLDHNQQPGFPVHRGQALKLWGTLKAGNYSYTIEYTFTDVGRIRVRVGGTAQNLRNLSNPKTLESLNNATHIHMGAWRMEFDLGNPDANSIQVIERVQNPQTELPTIRFNPFNAGTEGGVSWDPTKFTMIKIENSETMNRHDPPEPVSYVLKTRKEGKLRNDVDITNHDFWVSRLVPDNPSRQARLPELRFVDVARNTSEPEPIAGKAVVLWHNSELFHIPRGEDFGPVGYDRDAGAAINSYAGFDLVPVNLWHKTPFLDRAN